MRFIWFVVRLILLSAVPFWFFMVVFRDMWSWLSGWIQEHHTMNWGGAWDIWLLLPIYVVYIVAALTLLIQQERKSGPVKVAALSVVITIQVLFVLYFYALSRI